MIINVESKDKTNYRIEFKWNSVVITCIGGQAVYADEEEIYSAMQSLNLKEKKYEARSFVYRCPFWKRKDVIKEIRNI